MDELLPLAASHGSPTKACEAASSGKGSDALFEFNLPDLLKS